MKNEILEELWKTKDDIAEENKYDIDEIVKKLKIKRRKHKHNEVDFSQRKKRVA